MRRTGRVLDTGVSPAARSRDRREKVDRCMLNDATSSRCIGFVMAHSCYKGDDRIIYIPFMVLIDYWKLR